MNENGYAANVKQSLQGLGRAGAAAGSTGSDVGLSQSVLASVLSGLSVDSQELRACVVELERRLAPVMSPAGPEADRAKTDQSAVPLVAGLEALRAELRTTYRIVASIHERLSL